MFERNIIGLLVASTLSVSMLTGCSSKAANDTATTEQSIEAGTETQATTKIDTTTDSTPALGDIIIGDSSYSVGLLDGMEAQGLSDEDVQKNYVGKYYCEYTIYNTDFKVFDAGEDALENIAKNEASELNGSDVESVTINNIDLIKFTDEILKDDVTYNETRYLMIDESNNTVIEIIYYYLPEDAETAIECVNESMGTLRKFSSVQTNSSEEATKN